VTLGSLTSARLLSAGAVQSRSLAWKTEVQPCRRCSWPGEGAAVSPLLSRVVSAQCSARLENVDLLRAALSATGAGRCCSSLCEPAAVGSFQPSSMSRGRVLVRVALLVVTPALLVLLVIMGRPVRCAVSVEAWSCLLCPNALHPLLTRFPLAGVLVTGIAALVPSRNLAAQYRCAAQLHPLARVAGNSSHLFSILRRCCHAAACSRCRQERNVHKSGGPPPVRGAGAGASGTQCAKILF
jgi:hypothetical protein